MESFKDAALLLGHDMSRQDIKDVYDSINGKLDVKYKDIQNKDSRRLVKQLIESKLKEIERKYNIFEEHLRKSKELKGFYRKIKEN